MLERLSPHRRGLALFALVLVVLVFCWVIRSVLNPLLLGYLFAYILHPPVRRVEQLGLSRRTSVNLIFTAGVLVLIGVGTGLVLQVRSLALDVYENIDVQNDVQPRIDQFTEWLRSYGIPVESFSVVDPQELRETARWLLERFGVGGADAGLSAAGGAAEFLAKLVGRLARIGGLFFLVPVYAYFFLFQLGRLHGFVARYIPYRERGRLVRVSGQIGEVIANFFRGRLGVCFLKGVFLTVGLLVARVDYAFLFGMTSGFLSLIPFVGPMIGFVGAAAFGVIEHGVLGSLVRTGLVFGVGEVLEGYVLIPKILGDSLGLHPLVVLFALLAGGASFGMLGILVALPATASLVILAREFLLPVLGDLADEGATARPPAEP